MTQAWGQIHEYLYFLLYLNTIFKYLYLYVELYIVGLHNCIGAFWFALARVFNWRAVQFGIYTINTYVRLGVKYMSICIELYLNTIFEHLYLYVEVSKQDVFISLYLNTLYKILKYFLQILQILSFYDNLQTLVCALVLNLQWNLHVNQCLQTLMLNCQKQHQRIISQQVHNNNLLFGMFLSTKTTISRHKRILSMRKNTNA